MRRDVGAVAAATAEHSIRRHRDSTVARRRVMNAAVAQHDEYRTEPHAWQTQRWARAARRVGRHWVISRHVKEFCRPLTVEYRASPQRLPGPARGERVAVLAADGRKLSRRS